MTEDEEVLDVEADVELETIEAVPLSVDVDEFDHEDFDDDFDEDFEEESDDGYGEAPTDIAEH